MVTVRAAATTMPVREVIAAVIMMPAKVVIVAATIPSRKHVPVISREGQTVTVAVGSVLHPMTDVHYIAWILLETKNGEERKALQPGEEPVAQFYVAEDDEIIAAYEYCTLHGIWQAVPASDR